VGYLGQLLLISWWPKCIHLLEIWAHNPYAENRMMFSVHNEPWVCPPQTAVKSFLFHAKLPYMLICTFRGYLHGIHKCIFYLVFTLSLTLMSCFIAGVDFWKILMMAGGVMLFVLAPKLSHNIFFYYLCGMALGVCASFLFILFMFSKLLPRVCTS
jgi:hypothetical protein